LSQPSSMVVDSYGNLYVADMGMNTVNKYDSKGKFIKQFGKPGKGPGDILQPYCLQISKDNKLYILELSNSRISIFTLDGEYIKSIKSQEGLPLSMGASFVLDSEDNIFINAQFNGYLIHQLDKNGNLVRSFKKYVKVEENRINFHINNIGNIAINSEDELFLPMIYPYNIFKFNIEGDCKMIIKNQADYVMKPAIYSGSVLVLFSIYYSVVSPDGYIINGGVAIGKKPNRSELSEIMSKMFNDYGYINIFDQQGRYLFHKKLPVVTACFDDKGYIYLAKMSPQPHIEKCKMIMPEELK